MVLKKKIWYESLLKTSQPNQENQKKKSDVLSEVKDEVGRYILELICDFMPIQPLTPSKQFCQPKFTHNALGHPDFQMFSNGATHTQIVFLN